MKNGFALLLVVIALSSLQCYHAVFLPISGTTFKFVTYVLTVLFILLTCKRKGVEDKFFTMAILAVALCQLVSAYNAYAFKGQDFDVSLLATMQGFAYILFVPLMRSRLRLNDLEKIVQLLAVCYLLAALLNRISPITLFGTSDETLDRGTTRFRIVGIYWLMLFLLMKVNKYSITSKRTDLYWIICAALGILFSLTRQDIVVSALLGALLFFSRTRLIKKMALVGFTVLLFMYVLPQSKIYNSLVEKTLQEQASQEQYDNIRLVAADYFLFEYPRKPQQVLFGVGVPSFGNSSYGRQYEHFQDMTGIFREDVGYCGFYYNYGVIATLLIIIIFIRVLMARVPKEYIYLKYYAAAFLLLNIASAPCQPNVSIIPFMVGLYMVVLAKQMKIKE